MSEYINTDRGWVDPAKPEYTDPRTPQQIADARRDWATELRKGGRDDQ